MWIENQVFKDDMDYIINADFIKWHKFKNKTVFITGATGLIGYYLTSALLYRNMIYSDNIHVIILVRNIEKAKQLYSKQMDLNLSFIIGDVVNLPNVKDNIDYIIHAASPSDSKFFVNCPVETIKTIVNGCANILEMSKGKNINSMVFLSTMEVYGSIQNHEKIDELHYANLNTMSARNSYPEAKRICENMCASYYSEYKVPVNVLRLTQTFGPGIKESDNRVFAQFIRASIKKEDIVLYTEGKTYRSYLYLSDAVTAILTVLLYEKKGEAFNAANEESYCSIKEMANMVADDINNNKIKVVINKKDNNDIKQFLPQMCMNLDAKKLKNIGWKTIVTLKNMYKNVLYSIKYK